MQLPDLRQGKILRELRMHGMVEVADIAERLGVSSMTIRRDLASMAKNGTIERVHGGAVLPQPSLHEQKAPAMRGPSGHTATIGMIVPSASYYFPSIIRGAETAANEAGVRLVLGVTNYSADEECRQIKRLIAGGVNALIVTPGAVSIEGTETVQLLASALIPVVIVERSIEGILDEGPLESVRSDHVRGAELAVNHLLGLDRRRIALCLREGTPTGVQITEGYERALRRGGVEVRAELNHILPRALTSPNGLEQAINKLLMQCKDGIVDAALIHSDEDAIHAVDSAREAGLTVPDALAIVAYDDEIAALADVPLTAVGPPKYAVGYQALAMCLRRLTSPGLTDWLPLQRVNLSPNLTVRESTRI